jgi:DHA1 family inner membrane transport protein
MYVNAPEGSCTVTASRLGPRSISVEGLAGFGAAALLIGLMAAFTVGNVLSAVAPSYGLLVASRVIAGLPHGAFFGVAALVAVDLAVRGQAGRAVGKVMLGIPIANVLGVSVGSVRTHTKRGMAMLERHLGGLR